MNLLIRYGDEVKYKIYIITESDELLHSIEVDTKQMAGRIIWRSVQ